MKKIVKLTENDIKRMVRKVVNEISYGTVDDAQSVNYDTFGDLNHSFWKFESKLGELEEEFKEVEPSLYQNRNFNAWRTDSNNPYMNKIFSLMLKIESNLSSIREASDKINNILERKENQRDNFNQATMNYDNIHQNDDISWDEYRKGEINNV